MKRKSTFLRVFALLALLLPWSLQAQNAKVSEYDGASATATYSSIVSTGTAQTLNSDGYVDVSMPFAMYFGETQVPQNSTLRIYNNGSVAFNGIAALTDAMIAPLYYASGYTLTSVYTRSTAQMLTVEWRKAVSGSNVYSFQLKLYPGGDIEFCYGPMTISSSINVLVGMMSSSTDIYRVGGANNGSGWDTIYRNTTGTTTRTLSSTYAPAFDVNTNQGMVYTFTQPACVKPTGATAEATAWNTIKVDWTVSSNGNGYEVKYSPNADFDPNTEGTSKTVNSGTTLTTNLTNLAGNTTYYIYVRKLCSGAQSGWTDVTSATTPSGCPYLSGISSFNVTATTATISWTTSVAATSFDVRYNLGADFDPTANEGTLVNTTDTSKSLTGLTGASTYYYYVRANCISNLATEWYGPYTFNTACGAQNVPYTQTFADYSMPSCWNEEVISGSYNWNFYDGYAMFTWNTGARSRLISPILNIGTGDYQVDFYHAECNDGSAQDSLCVYYRTSATGDWVLLQKYGNGADYNNLTLSKATILLPNTNATYQLAFEGQGHGGYNVYLANIVVRPQPTCPAPTGLAATSAGVVTWTANTNNTSYDVLYGLAGFTSVEEGTLIENVTGTTYTIAGLAGSTSYDIYVRAHCSATNETSEEWVGPVTISTPCAAVTSFPWSEDFESFDASSSGITFSAPCWVNEHISGNGSYFFEMYSGTNGTNSTKKLRLRDMSSGTMTKLMLPLMNLPGNNYRFVLDVFRNATGTSYTAEGIRIFVSTNGEIEGATELAFISRNCTQTDGNHIPAESGSGWYTYELPIGISGNCYIIIRGESKYGSHTYMDNFVVEQIPTCLAPTNLAAVATATGAELSWTENSGTPATQWEIAYWKAGTTDTVNIIANSNPYTVNYLAMGTTYNWQVRSLCSADDQSAWSAEYSFSTEACLSFVANPDIEIGESGTTNSYIPTYTYYNYSLTEQIYTSTELGGVATTISSVSFYNTGAERIRNIDVYLVETEKESFSGSTDWVPVTAANLVYSGSHTFTGGDWSTITFTTPFAYSGTNNIVLVVDDNTGSYQSSVSFRATAATSKAIRIYSDPTNYNPASPSSYSGTILAARNDVKFGNGSCDQGTCQPPTVAITVGPDGDNAKADLTFTGDEDAFGYICVTQGTTPNIANGVTVTGNTATITPLVPETAYDLYVYSVCSGVTNPSMVRYSFTTPFVPTCKPQVNFATSNVTFTGATVTWQQEDPNQVPESWTIRYAIEDFDPATAAATDYTEATVTSATYTISGLHNGDHVYFYTKATCNAAQNDYSVNWSSYDFAILTCETPTAVAATDVTNSTAMIHWTSNSTAWTLKYGVSGFDPDNEGTTVAVTVDSIELTGLDAYTYYDVYVKSNCTTAEESGWSDICTFRTKCPDGGDIALGDRTGTNGYLPYYKTYNYSLSEQIYTADELGGAANTLRSLSYEVISGDAEREAKIYVGHTSLSSFSGASDAISTDGLTLVFDGNMTANIGWNTINFTTNFDYDGASNLVVVVQRPYHLWNEGTAASFGVIATSTTQALYSYSDNYEITPANVTSGTNTVVSVKNNFIFGANCNTDVTCFAPATVNATVAENNSVTVTWTARTDLRPVVNNFEMKYGIEGFNPDNAGTLVPNLNNVFNYIITADLAYDNTYDVYVRTVCGDGDYSNWTKATFTTYPSCWAPTELAVTGTTSNSATLSWTENTPTAATRWEVAYGLEGFDPDRVTPVETTNNTACVVTGLKHSTKYEFYVRAKCSASDVSPWSAVASATTQCGAWQIEDLPFVENFDGVTGTTSSTINNHVLPNCWDYINTSSTTTGTSTSGYPGYPIAYNGAGTSHSGNNHMRFYEYTSAAYGDQYAILPQLGFTPSTLSFGQPLIVGFYAREDATTASHVGTIQVGVMTDPTDATTFVAVGDPVLPTTTSYEYFEVDLSSYIGTGTYIALKAPKPTSGYNAVYVDDLTVKFREKVNTLADNGSTQTICNEYVMADTANGGTYHSNLNATYVLRPAETGKVAHITGSYDLEYGYDYIRLYRGAVNANNLVATYTGTGDIDYVTTSYNWVDSGYVTVVFTTDNDNALKNAGFKLLVECECPSPDADADEPVEAIGTYTWNGVTYTNNIVRTGLTYDATAHPDPDVDIVKTQVYTYTNVAGCDSVTKTLQLTLHPTYNLTYNATICERDAFTFYGNEYTATNTYTVPMTSQYGADSTGILILQVNPAPSAAIYRGGNAVTEITGHCDNADLTLLARSNSTNATFVWDDESTEATRVVNPHETGTYTVVATNPTTGCTSLPASVTVTTTPVPALTINGDAEICFGQSATLTLTDANNVEATYRWSNGATGTSITVNPTETTTYSVTATTSNASACTATAEFTVTVNPLPVVTATASVNEICSDSIVTLTATAVEDYSYSWSTGATTAVTTVAATSSMAYTVTVTDGNGCVNEFNTATVTVHPSYELTDSLKVCYVNNPYTWGDMELTSNGSYDQNFTIAYGCDSLVHLAFTFEELGIENSNIVRCYGDSYTFEGITRTATADTNLTYQLGIGDVAPNGDVLECPVRYNLAVTVNPVKATAIEQTVCDTYTWPVSGETYTESGAYPVTLATTKNCDSVVTLNLTVNYQNTGVETVTACDSYVWDLNGVNYTATTNEPTFTLQNQWGCDSVVTLDLTVNYRSYHEEFHCVRDAQSYTWINGGVYTLNVDLADSIQFVTGENDVQCNEIALLHLVMNPVIDTLAWNTVEACDEYEVANAVVFNDEDDCDGHTEVTYLRESGDYELRTRAADGHDQWTRLHLTINTSTYHTTVATECLPYTWTIEDENGDPFEVATITEEMVNGANPFNMSVDLAEAGFVTANCSSIEVLRLTPKYPSTEITDEVTICANNSWTADNNIVFSGSEYATGIYTWDNSTLNEAGCPLTKQVSLTVNPVYSVSTELEFCESDFALNEESGEYELTVSDANHEGAEVVLTIPGALNQEVYTNSVVAEWNTALGCDSTVAISYTVNPTMYEEVYAEACYDYTWDLNQELYKFADGAEQTASFAEETENGCRKVTTLHLTLKDTVRGYETREVCTSFEYNGETYRTDKTFVELYDGEEVVSNGCDSVTYITFHINQTELIHQYVVSNRPYTWQNGQTFSQSVENVYYDEPSEGDCGNVYSLHLTMVDPIVFCDDAFPYQTGVGNNNITLTTNDIVTDEASFCLSNPWYTNVGFSNGAEVVWGIKFEANRPNDIYHVQGAQLYYKPLTDYNLVTAGDYTMNIYAGGDNAPGTLIGSKTVNISATETEGWKYFALDAPVTVREQNLWVTFRHVNDDASANYASTVVRFFDANDQNGAWTSPDGGTTWQYLNENNSELHYSYMIKAVYTANIWRNNDPNGNDTILYYTVNPTYNTTATVDTCDSYTWEGQTYTESGNYTMNYTSAEGCDSVLNLNLTVRNSNASSVDVAVCDTYTWASANGGNDSTYTVSGSYTNTITNEAGCDSVITLNLTVNKNNGAEVTVNNGCDSYTWDRSGVTYTESGDYSVSFTDGNGCEGDSVLHLTINPSYETFDTLVVNEGGSYTYLGVMYSSDTGAINTTIVHTFQSVSGCDSISHLTLIIPVLDDIVEINVEACSTYTWEAPDGTGHTYGWIPMTERQSHGMALYKDLTANKYVYSYPTDTTFDANGVMTQVRVLHLNLLEATTSTETLNIPVSLGSYDILNVVDNSVAKTLTFTYADRGTTVADTVGVGSVAYCDDYRAYTINYIDNYDTTVVYSCADATTYEWNDVEYALGVPGSTDFFTQKENEGTLTELVHVLKVINRPVNAVTVTETACDTYTWETGDGQTYTTGGTYLYNYTDSNQCAATMTLNLTINVNSNTEITKDECDSYTWTAADGGNGNAYTATGDYTYNYTAENGCPSVNTLHLTIRNNTNQTITKAECETYTWSAEDGGDGRVLTASGTVTYEYTAENGCPSVNTLNLTINLPTNTGETIVACDSTEWNGTKYYTSGDYTYDYTSAAGCASTDTLHLTVNNATHNAETTVQCDSYVWNGQTYTESSTAEGYTYSYTNDAGCPSVDTLYLTINVNTSTINDVVTACDEYVWAVNDRLYSTTGNYTARTTDANGCATTNTLTLTINNSSSYDSVLYVSDGSYRYTYQDAHQQLFGEGVYNVSEHYTNVAGCDSTLNITLNIGTALLGIDNVVNCNSYTWRNGETYVFIDAAERAANLNADNEAPLYKTSTGTYIYYNPTYTVPQQNNYDSIYMLALTLTQSYQGYDEVTLNISDQVVNYAPIYDEDDEITGYNYTFNFDTLAALQQNFVATDKEFELHFPAVQYCDSVITLTVHLLNNYEEVIADAADICVTTTSYEWRGHTVNTATNDYDHAHVYYVYDTLASGTIEYITVNQHPVSYATERRTACDEYTWNGTTYTESTSNATAYFPAGTVFNAGTEDEYTLICDSTVTLMLTINHNTSTEYTVAECNTYTWAAVNGGNGETYTESGDYTYDYLTDKGCPSTNTLHLTINLPTSTEYTVDVCDSYTWTVEEGGDDRVLTASGEYTYNYNTAEGCESVNTLNLTIRNNSNQTVTKTVCDTYTWTATDNGDDLTYTESGTYTYEYEAENGCPSVNTLNLTVNQNSGHTDAIVACDSYEWHGTEYTADNNTATYSYVDANNCPSVDTLNLTVNHSTHNAETVIACQTYEWHGTTYTNPSSVGDMFYGDYQYNYYNDEGCLSTDTLHLTLGGGRSFSTETVTNCGPYTWIVNGEEVGVLDETMETTTTYTNPNTGCEHVVFLNLTILEAPETVIPVTLCDNELPYTWTDGDERSLSFTEAGEGSVTYPFSENCDSTVRVVLTVNPTMVTNLTDQVCLGNGYTDNGFNIAASELATAGEYTFVDHRTTEAGCEHTYNLTLTVGDVINNEIEEVACDSYTWDAGDGETYTFTATGTYNSEAYANAMGCTTVDVLTLTINNNAGSVYSETRCFSYVWNGNEYTESGDYTYEYVDGNGCASVDTLHLTINQNASVGETVVACESYDWHNVSYTQSGTYYHHYTTEEGCASIDTLFLTVNAPVSVAINETACDKYTWEATGTIYTESAQYTATFTAANGCDSVVTLNLTINSYQPTVKVAEVCDSYEWNGTTYTTSGTYAYTNTDANGCSGNDTLVLTINSYEPTVETIAACDSYTWNGTDYTSTGTYTYSNTNDNGCSGVDTLNLTINASTTSSFDAITCNTYSWNGVEYNATGVYAQTLQTANGCDSVVTMNLTVSPAAQINVYETTCGSYTWDNDTYTASGIYTHTYTTASGCDSVVNLMLTINAPITNTVTATACDSYTWIDGQTYTASTNTPSVTLNAANGCDSIVTLNLTINNSVTNSFDITACNGYTWNGATYTNTGAYTQNYLTANGCDSIVTLNLTISPVITTTITTTQCNSYTWEGTNYTTSGVYTHTYTAANGCDSVVTLILTIKNDVTSTVTATACDSYTWNGLNYTSTGAYTHTYTAANGCDSVVTLNLTVNSSATSSFSETVCGSYTWNGATYTTSGAYTHTYTTVGGCDSVVTLNLTISPAITTTVSEQACGSYTWNGITYSVSGVYTYTYTAANGCDSIVTLNLTILPAIYTNVTETACDSYTWDGTTYTTSGIYTNTYTTVNGCDSNVTLLLTITTSLTNTIAETACDSYTWNGTEYTTSGVYTATFASAAECDSIVVLNLTINNSDSTTETITACESYTWIDGETYTASTNTPTVTLTNAAGCDSVVTLDLTVNYVTYGIDEQVACDGFIWIDGNNYTESTDTPVDTITGANGCDSIVTLHLTINNSVEVYETITVNSTDLPYTWREQTIPDAGDYTFYATTVNGCDSTVYLHVNVNQIGIDIVSSLDDLKVYPNPTRGQVTISAEDVVKVEVLDIVGRLVATFEDTNTFDLSNLAEGAYTLRITLPEGVTVRKVVKK